MLDLEDNPIRVKGAAAFAEVLLRNKSLKELNLQGTKIGEEGVKKLNESLTYNTTVRLWFPGLVMDDSEATDESDSRDELKSTDKSDSRDESKSTDESDSRDESKSTNRE